MYLNYKYFVVSLHPELQRYFFMQNKKKILVLAPHADDEVLGCGGYLMHQKAEGAIIMIVVATIGGTDKRQNIDERKDEFLNVLNEIGAEGKVLYYGKDALLDTVTAFELTSRIDKIIDEFRPDEVFLSYKSRHQDHIKLYDCALASFRLREGYQPKLIALYEYPFVQDGLEPVKGGKMYHDISDVIDRKIAVFNLYKSQVRQSPSPLNGDGIRKFSSFRGIESGLEYAELFYVQKMIV